jgi:hypothetical protein
VRATCGRGGARRSQGANAKNSGRDSLVLEKLVACAPTDPDAVLHAVELMIETPKERWMVSAWIDEIIAIIRATLGTSGEARARRLGARLIADNFDNGLIEMLRPRAE